jgi:type II secretory pathway pseudopilin PulG
VVAMIAILAGIVIFAFDPVRQLGTGRNAQRMSDITQINAALDQYFINNFHYPPSVPTTALKEICDTGTASSTHDLDCTDLVDLSVLVPDYLVAIPRDPTGENNYEIMKDGSEKIILTAPDAENDAFVAIGTSTPEGGEEVEDPIVAGLREGLVAYYPLDGDTNDYKGSNDLVIQGDVSSTEDAILGSAYNLNGGYLEAENGSLLNNYSAATFCGWVKLSNLSQYTGIFNTRNDAGDPFFSIQQDVTYRNQVFFWFVKDGEYSQAQNGDYVGNIDAGSFYHICGTWDGSTGRVKIYSNGDYVDLGYHSGVIGTLGSALTDLYIGYNGEGVSYGVFDDVAIWNRALEDSEISDLYNENNGRSLLVN